MNVFIKLDVATAAFHAEQVVEAVTRLVHDDAIGPAEQAILEEIENVELVDDLKQGLATIATEMSLRFAKAVTMGFTGTANDFFMVDLNGDMGEMLFEAFSEVCGD